MKKRILFLSYNDFKEKSIQVNRKTPLAFIENGWIVDYVVARNDALRAGYFYEKEINPEGINIFRFKAPFSKFIDSDKKLISFIFAKLSEYYVIYKLFRLGLKQIKKEKYNVIYGYEIHGVMSLILIKYFVNLKRRNISTVTRFQGTWITNYIKEKKYKLLLLNLKSIVAMRSKSDLCIMTDDGTQGDLAMKMINSKSLNNFKFWVNGVDKFGSSDLSKPFKGRIEIGDNKKKIILSVSRLEGWKRVERNIEIVSRIKSNNILYFIIGEGGEKSKLETLVRNLELEEKIIFLGAIRNREVQNYMNISDIFLSMYDLSNVGNPLLEAIRSNLVIFTLNNGDTSKWIEYGKNGFIYNLDDDLYNNVAMDIDKVINNSNLEQRIKENVKLTEKNKLWSWAERFDAEINEVLKITK